MINNQLLYTQSTFQKMFFIDKFKLKSSFQCPDLKSVVIRVPLNSKCVSKIEFYKLILMFYLTSGQKPKILIKSHNLQGLRKIHVVGFLINLKLPNLFVKRTVFRSLAIVAQFKPFILHSSKNFNFMLRHQTQDDDFWFQILSVPSFFYSVLLKTSCFSKTFLKSFLLILKIPCN